MPPAPINHRRQESQSTYRASILPSSTGLGNSTAHFGSTGSSTSMSAAKSRQYAHLQSQLAQLNANLSDTQNLLRMTSVQAGDIRFLGGYVGAMFMGSAKILGEEGVKANADAGTVEVKKEASDDD